MNTLFVPHNKKTISLAYKSKYNHKRKNQVILLMITDGEKWHGLVVRSLSALFRGITSSNNGDFYCLNCFHSYRTHNKLKKHERVCNNHDYCHVDMPKENEKMLKYNHKEKSSKAPFISTPDLECILEKEQSRQNNLQNSSMEMQIMHGKKKIKPECDFMGFKNNRLNYRCKECGKKML